MSNWEGYPLNLLVLLTILVAIAVMVFTLTKMKALSRSYYLGINLWATGLPVLAAGMVILIIGSNLSSSTGNGIFALGKHLSRIELMLIFLASPLLFSKISNIVGITLTIYCVEKIVLSDNALPPSLAMISLLSFTTIVAILGDKMPWNITRKIDSASRRLREIFTIGLSFFCLAFVFATIMELQGFSKWLEYSFQISFSPKLNMIILIFLLLGWLSVALGITRHFILPILCLPSLFAIAYTTNSPSYMMAIPFALSLSLSLAITDRRLILRR